MNPSHPLSPDGKRPSNTATPIFIDFFAKEREDQLESAKEREDHLEIACARHQQGPFAGLGLRRMMDSPRAAEVGTVEDDTEVTSAVTVETIRFYLSARPDFWQTFLKDSTIQNRLNSLTLSPATLLAALEIAYAPSHPIFTRFGARNNEREALVSRLVGIMTNVAGLRGPMRTIIANSNDDSTRLVESVFQYVRGSKNSSDGGASTSSLAFSDML